MKIVPPITVTDDILVSSNVDVGPAAGWNSGTTYALGDVVSGVNAISLKTQYASLQNGNTNHDPAASTGWWRAIGQAAAEYDAGTTYVAEDGAQLDADGTHRLFRSTRDDNTGNDPTIDAGDHWLVQSATNYWAMHDLALGFSIGNTRIATRWPEVIDNVYAPTTDVDTVVVWVVDAATVRVSVADTGYDETVTLTGDANETKWQLNGVARLRAIAFEDVNHAGGSEIRVEINNPGGIAVCAELIMGKAIEVADNGAEWGAQIGIQDYSNIQANDFGVLVVSKRPWHRTASYQIWVARADADYFAEFMTLYRGTALQFIGQPNYRLACVFGLARSFKGQMTLPDWVVYSLDLESV
jgi:hypothetical protein